MKFFEYKGSIFAGEIQGDKILDVSTIQKKYPRRSCFEIVADEIKDCILFEDGDILPLNSSNKTLKLNRNIQIRYVGNVNIALKLKKRMLR